MMRVFFSALLFFFSSSLIAGAGEYLSQQEFLSQNLGPEHKSRVIWFDQGLREMLKRDLNHLPSSARLRYWSAGKKRVWIVEEIGRDKPITMGFVTENKRIIKFEVLAFRESRGYEIRYPRFSQQLQSLELNEQYMLNHHIDNITGATLSVNAVKKMARFVLYLDDYLAQQ